jgi:hypothetical protein
MSSWIIRLGLLAALLLCRPALAWNSAGHQIIGLIAWDALSAADREAAAALLADHPRFAQHFQERMPENVWAGSATEQRQWMFAHAGTWPDQVRRAGGEVTRQDVAAFNRPEWHYINLPVYLTPADKAALAAGIRVNRAKEPPSDRDSYQQNILQAMQNAMATLRDPSATRPDQAVALCWFLHLAGDSHQPCHASALFTRQRFPQGDRGGNDIFIRGKTKLHAYWDGAIFSSSKYNDVRAKTQKLMGGAQPPTEKLDFDPAAWLLESYQLAGNVVYDAHVRSMVTAAEGMGPLPPMNPPRSYSLTSQSIAAKRAVLAGRRIAACLQELLPPPDPESESTPLPANPLAPARPRLMAPTSSPPSTANDATADASYWLNTKSNVRHNAGCRWFGHVKNGRACTASEGEPCGMCGG